MVQPQLLAIAKLCDSASDDLWSTDAYLNGAYSTVKLISYVNGKYQTLKLAPKAGLTSILRVWLQTNINKCVNDDKHAPFWFAVKIKPYTIFRLKYAPYLNQSK